MVVSWVDSYKGVGGDSAGPRQEAEEAAGRRPAGWSGPGSRAEAVLVRSGETGVSYAGGRDGVGGGLAGREGGIN